MRTLQNLLDMVEKWRNKKLLKQPGEIGNFWRHGGNKLLFEGLPVNTNAFVIDAGAFRGEWTNGMITRYGCKVIMFEPVPSLFTDIDIYYKNNLNINVINAALGSKNMILPISINEDSSSLFKQFDNNNSTNIEVLDIAKFLIENNLNEISCFKLNIEGGEYDVIERLIEANLIQNCKSILVQFHKQPSDYQSRYSNIEISLKKTHNLIWKFSFVWELWVRK
jgi:FkbM family methyltransferase